MSEGKMSGAPLKVGIVGGGIGGLAAAIGLRRAGCDVAVYEQAPQFARVGADVNLTPNAVRALDGLGVATKIRKTAAWPTRRISRTWDTGEVTSNLEMGDEAERRYGAPQLTIHRADLLTALQSQLPDDVVRHGIKVTGFVQRGDAIELQAVGREPWTVDVLIGADGIHSAVRTTLFGAEVAQYTGVVAYRTVVPRARLSVPNLDAFTKWWGPDPSMQIVTFPLNCGEEIFVFATLPQPDWRHESWTTPGDIAALRPLFAGFHPDARALLDACDQIMASALCVRDPLPKWSVGSVTLLGDACHPMMPFMAQGACQSIEDAVVLARCLTGVAAGDVPQALRRYETTRLERTARIQIGSRGNEWLRDGGNADWVYAYDAWSVGLA